MSESSSKDYPRPQIPIRLPDGQIVNLFDLIERNRRNLESTMPTGSLKRGDLIAFGYSEGDGTNGGFVFEVKEAEWKTLGITGEGCPSPTLVGRLDGPDLPDEVKDKDCVFTGSGFGTSIVGQDTLATAQSPYFSFPEGEYIAPVIDLFTTFRRDQSGNLRQLSPNQLDAETRGKTTNHDQRLAKVEQLMEIFGFHDMNFRSGQTASPYLHTYQDKRYVARFEPGMGMGNQLAIMDKQTGQWMEFKYFNSRNEDFLQIAFADLSDRDLRDFFLSDTRGLTSESHIHRSRVAITTFTSSGRYGIEVVNYMPSGQEDVRNLGVPKRVSHMIRPDIQIWANGRTEVQINYFQPEPGLLERIKRSIQVTPSSDGAIVINLNGKNVKLKNPDVEIEKIIKLAGKEGEVGSSEDSQPDTLRSKAGRIIGRFIRRKNT